jgi:wobble nucleotide-excising tRNase
MYHLNQFILWQVANPNGCVDIKISRGNISIWVYDYTLMHGMFVDSVDEIDILADLKKDDIKKLEEIKRRHGNIYDDVIVPVAPGIDVNLGNGGAK